MKGMTFEQIVINAFDQLEPFYLAERTGKSKLKTDKNLSADYKLLKLQLGTSQEAELSKTEKRALPLQLSTQNLAKFIGTAGTCWVLEDFHKIEESEKIKFAQMMKLFADLSDEFPQLKIIAIGAVNTAREVIRFDKEMQNRVSEIPVELMSDNEISQIIDKGSLLLNVKFEKQITQEIIHSSNGLASICHKLCFIMCEQEDIFETLNHPFTFEIGHLENAIAEHIADNSDSMKAAFDKAYKLKDADKILRLLSDSDSSGQTFQSIIEALDSEGQERMEAKLQLILDELQTEEYGSNLIFDPDSCKYSFSNPFFAAFARTFFQHIDSRRLRKKVDIEKEMNQIFNQVIRSLVEKGLQDSLFDISDFSQDSGMIRDPRW